MTDKVKDTVPAREFYTKDRNSADIERGFLEVGDYTYGVVKIFAWPKHFPARLIVGKYCSIAYGVQVFLGGNHRTDWVSTYPFATVGHWKRARGVAKESLATNGDVVIGSDVWLGRFCTIMSGIKIGHGAVVAAGALVVKDVPPYGIVGGNPAKLLKYRFPEEIRERLLSIAWWDWPDERVAEVADLLSSNNLDELFSYAKRAFVASDG